MIPGLNCPPSRQSNQSYQSKPISQQSNQHNQYQNDNFSQQSRQQSQQQQQQFQQQQQQQQQSGISTQSQPMPLYCPNDQYDILDLDHIIGYSGRNKKLCQYHPYDPSKLIYALGGLIIIENLNDKHDQIFLRGHNMPVSAIAITQTGDLIASGQYGATNVKACEAPIILWDYKLKKSIHIYNGLKDQITNLSFSHDAKFLCATSSQNQFTIWNTEDFSLVYNKLHEIPTTLIEWSIPRKSQNKYNIYQLISSLGPQIILNTLEFNINSMQYALKQTHFQLPSAGLIRTYTSAIIDNDGNFVFVGTSTGEICIYSISNLVFKAAIPVSNNGVHSIQLSNNYLFIGSGDGKLKKLKKLTSSTQWQQEGEIQLEGVVNSLSLYNEELIAGTNENNIYRIQVSNLNSYLYTEGSVNSLVAVAFKPQNTNFFATMQNNGQITIWDTNDIKTLTKCVVSQLQKSPSGHSLCICETGEVLGGYGDGFVRAFQQQQINYSPKTFDIVNAHKGAVTALYSNNKYIISGGQDGLVRVWSRHNRQLITQISIHTKEVVSVFPDILKPQQIHSVSIDKSIHSYDLQTDKKVILHQLKNGTVLDMTQRVDHEQELVTCGVNTDVLFWDCDVAESVEQLMVGERINSIQISPSGNYMALGNDTGDVLIFGTQNKNFQGKYSGHSARINKLKWASDEKQIVSVSIDGSICIWNFFG